MQCRFQFRRYRVPFRAAVRTAHGLWSEREGVIVRLELESGASGLGEASPIAAFGTETVDEIAAACRELGEWGDVERLMAVPAKLACLRNAIAVARAEVEARNNTAEGPATAPAGDPPYLALAALLPAGRAALTQIPAKADIGFRVFKWKVGVGDLADELSLLDDVCAALPDGAKLRLDANGAWDRRQAERWLELCADRPVEFLEQPVARDARGAADLLLGLAQDFPTPLALDESLVSEGDLERWLGAGWPGVFVVKPALLGDVAGAVASLQKAGATVVFSSALETAVGARAALRVALAWTGNARVHGFGVWPLFADGRFNGPMAMPFLRAADIARMDVEAVWSALT